MEHLPEALYSAADTREADRRAAELHGLGGGVLMERAASAALHLLRQRYMRATRLAVVCGPGNNGGDGFVLARLARAMGMTVRVLSPADTSHLKGDAKAACRLWQESGGVIEPIDSAILRDSDVVVDALFGTGMERPLEGVWRAAVEAMNVCGKPILALDIPSGLNADTGAVASVAVRADVTVSFIALKAGLFTARGREQAGLILLHDLNVPAEVFAGLAPRAQRITERHLRGLLRPRPRHAHKGDAGRVLIVGGQPGMAGAVRLAGEAAYRAGCGLVTIATHPSHATVVNSARPEIISYGAVSGAEVAVHAGPVLALAVGPGLALDAWGRELWQAALQCRQPLVVDAGALRCLAESPRRRDNWVLTPHPGEAAVLLGSSIEKIESDRIAAAGEIARRFGGVCVLKGCGTIVATADEEIPSLCDRGNPGLASGGTGDVLTGVIVSFLAQGLAPRDAARLGVFVHAAAADCAAEKGERGLLAGDLFTPLRKLVNDIANAI